ncbi:hypothetical protein KOR34_44840 [Posidoniimonas corsicana]|uniref:Uncharacterized protein n=1 Tax=Posidoniimonas corsicana TaxID=1938618 RepID=A0A5C5UZR2_9BACT|nr:hypothetical protein [Posidoniimonas corsicana]TWT31110.1 hypothetical protein KOR34_44840 [Posidoniimonas corsicana]
MLKQNPAPAVEKESGDVYGFEVWAPKREQDVGPDNSATRERIAELEAELTKLRGELRDQTADVFVFRCVPESKVFVYADCLSNAIDTLKRRMAKSYGNAWAMDSQTVQRMPLHDAARESPGNLIYSFGELERSRIVRDVTQSKERWQRLPNQGTYRRLLLDVEDYERRQRANAK